MSFSCRFPLVNKNCVHWVSRAIENLANERWDFNTKNLIYTDILNVGDFAPDKAAQKKKFKLTNKNVNTIFNREIKIVP